MILPRLGMYTAMAFAALLWTGCNDDDDAGCDPSLIEVRSLEQEYGCPDTPYGIALGIENDFIIISSQAEYEQWVTGTCNAVIDYDEFDLVIGSQQVTGTLTEIDYTYRQVCPTFRFELIVVIHTTASSSTPTLTYHALVPKLGTNQAVDVVLEV